MVVPEADYKSASRQQSPEIAVIGMQEFLLKSL
jgi:hypothetical protein